MATVHVTNQAGTPLDGAFVQVFAPGFLGFLGGYNATETTDTNGNASFPGPSFFTLPNGSSADVIVNWTDPVSGVKYAGEGNWGVAGLPGLSLAYEYFTPDPLHIQLVTNLTIQNESGPGGGFNIDELFGTIEIAGIIFVVVVLAGVGYVLLKEEGVFNRKDYGKTEP